MCDSIQARLQSRIARRAAKITDVLSSIEELQGCYGVPVLYSYLVGLKADLRQLEQDQKLDKNIISRTYWG
jgi:hypothetical protein